jgi:thiamine biosynthesis lipoprotein
LVAAWGFGAGAGNRGLPSLDERRAATVGWQRLSIDPAAGTASKSDAALQADLSGIAKGYAVDLAAQALEALGLQRYMVEAGGELRTRGLNSAGRPWQIAVEQPDAWPQRARQIVPLQGLAMATSGDYRNFYELQGRRYCHEIDPASREPISNGLASVTVVAPECAYADAMATALIVLGPERGLALAQRLGLPTLFIVREAAGGLRDLATPAFAALGARAVA